VTSRPAGWNWGVLRLLPTHAKAEIAVDPDYFGAALVALGWHAGIAGDNKREISQSQKATLLLGTWPYYNINLPSSDQSISPLKGYIGCLLHTRYGKLHS